ncbi:MAG: NirA family protein [Verrucomicrobiota bacterium]|nr:NirA family protein [Verrucomicrobiota bacterium]
MISKQKTPDLINGKIVTDDQKSYLQGFFSGLANRGITFSDLQGLFSGPDNMKPTTKNTDVPLIFEERVKNEEHPLDSYYLLVENAQNNKAPDKEETFRFKWHGLFFLSPVKDAYMARLRIPGGFLKTFQLREIANTAQELTSGYVQITTRANFQIRLIEPRNTMEFLRRIQSVGLHTRGSGADNIRNITTNPTAGIDPHELIDTTPFVHELGQFILSHREFYDLPRKFNIAFDGGGLIGSVEDTNDIGCKAVRVIQNNQGIEPGIYFRIKLGGATGHKAFAHDTGVLIRPEGLVQAVLALIRVFITHGCRTDRKKSRLKHLLEKMPIPDYITAAESLLGSKLLRDPFDKDGVSGICAPHILPPAPHSHVGVFPQKQEGFYYIGIGIPVGQVTPHQLLALADIADQYGHGEIRLSVWQNIILPWIIEGMLDKALKKIHKLGFTVEPSNVSSGIIACTGNRFCKYAASDTKAHAIALGKYLDKKVLLKHPVNIHFTGCPHSCAQHYMGDIGLLATKVGSGPTSVEGYHITIGGGFGESRSIGREIFKSIPFSELPQLIEKILNGYLRHTSDIGGSFQDFTRRHDINTLQAIFTNNE